MQKAGWKRIILLKIFLICGISLSACAGVKESRDARQETEQSPTPMPFSEKPEQAVSEVASQENTESDSMASTRVLWKVNINPDMPQPFLEVMKQYEQFMNADNRDINDDSVQAKFWDGVDRIAVSDIAEPMKFEWMPLVCENEPYIEAYKDFILHVDTREDSDFPILGYYLFDLNFDDIPELGVLHDSLGSMGGYFTLYRFDGSEIVRILDTDYEPVQISNYTQILADDKNQKVYLLKEMYLLVGNENGLYGYLKEMIYQNSVPYVHTILHLTVQHQGCDQKEHIGQNYLDEDSYLSDKELEECLFTEYYLEDKWKEISSEEYLTIKREIIPKENDFVDVRRYENLHILGSESDLITDEAEYKNAQFTEEEIDSLFIGWNKYLLKNTP